MANVYEEHPILHHYTDMGGLKGILESGSLWATHYKALNDFTETEQMRELLEKMIYKIINPKMSERARNSLKYKRFLEKNGGVFACSNKEAKNLVDLFYEITFHGRESRDVGPYAEPFVVSFCAHTNHEDYVKENGLLSMWRAYGNAGGFALEFDAKKLWYALCSEPEYHGYLSFSIADVIYDDSDADFADEFDELSVELESFLSDLANATSAVSAGNIFQPFFTSVTRFKHQGFKEESEVRLVAAPLSSKLKKIAIEEVGLKEANSNLLRPTKTVLSRQKQDIEAKYIVLNAADPKGKLPIRRVIVGPQKDHDEIVEQVRKIAGAKVEIKKSETPYIAR